MNKSLARHARDPVRAVSQRRVSITFPHFIPSFILLALFLQTEQSDLFFGVAHEPVFKSFYAVWILL